MKITDSQIRALRDEALKHRDDAMYDICVNALYGNSAARAECQRVIDDARAQDDE